MFVQLASNYNVLPVNHFIFYSMQFYNFLSTKMWVLWTWLHCWGGGGDVMKRFINSLFKVGLGLDCDCLFLFFSLHPLGPLNKV